MASTAPDLVQKHRLSVTDYHRMGEAGILREDARVELIEGEVVNMSPIGSTHSGTLNRLVQVFQLAVRQTAIVSVQNPVVLGIYSEPQPDLALLHPREDFYTNSHPRPEDVLLLIEVCESSLRYDHEIKLPLYARHGIPEVWLVDVDQQRLSLFRTPLGDVYQDLISPAALGVISLERLPGTTVDLSRLFQPVF